MHTIKSQPSFYVEGKQICYANNGSIKIPESLCSSLKELRKVQKLSNKWRTEQGFDETEHSYIRVKVQEK